VESGFGARSELDRWGECMKSHGLLVSVGTSFVALSVLLAGCPVPEAKEWPNGEPRPPGGEPIPATGPSGGGGAGGIGGTSSGTGGTGGGGGASCGDSKADTGESCDDGNKVDGDGCSSTCQVEACWECSGGACMPSSQHTPCNNGTQGCDGKGACSDCVIVDMVCDNCKSCAGSPCIKNGDCASDVCITGVCRSATGSACVDSVECASNYCGGGPCAECTIGAQCTSGSCNTDTGQCYAAIGEPCDSSMTCGLGLNCTSISICKGANGVGCTGDHECVSNRCAQTGKCSDCSTNLDCGGELCDLSTKACPLATLPNGAYCVNSEDCASNNCTDFPRRCAP